jgi:hypothetical protein
MVETTTQVLNDLINNEWQEQQAIDAVKYFNEKCATDDELSLSINLMIGENSHSNEHTVWDSYIERATKLLEQISD